MRFPDILGQLHGSVTEWSGLYSAPFAGIMTRGPECSPDFIVDAHTNPGQLTIRPGGAAPHGSSLDLAIPFEDGTVAEALDLTQAALHRNGLPYICAIQPTGAPTGEKRTIDGHQLDWYEGVIHIWCGPVLDADAIACGSLLHGTRVRWRSHITDRVSRSARDDAPISIEQSSNNTWRLRSGRSWEGSLDFQHGPFDTIGKVLAWGSNHYQNAFGRHNMKPRFSLGIDDMLRVELW